MNITTDYDITRGIRLPIRIQSAIPPKSGTFRTRLKVCTGNVWSILDPKIATALNLVAMGRTDGIGPELKPWYSINLLFASGGLGTPVEIFAFRRINVIACEIREPDIGLIVGTDLLSIGQFSLSYGRASFCF